MAPTRNIFYLLDEVRARPGMWVGDVDDSALARLETILHGYSAALDYHSCAEPGLRFNQMFSEYLLQSFHWSVSCGWAAALAEQHPHPVERFERFFLLVDKYRQLIH